jgi:hypothetical protein
MSSQDETAGDATMYCVLPPDLLQLYDALRDHFSDDPGIDVIVERRSGDDRRDGTPRRGGERRAILSAVDHRPPLPDELAAHADSIIFVELCDRETPALASGGRSSPPSEHPAERAARVEAELARARERCREAESEVHELLRALVGAADDLRGFSKLSPRRFLAIRRAEHAIERHRRRSLSRRR